MSNKLGVNVSVNGETFRKSSASGKYCGCVGVRKEGDNFVVTNTTTGEGKAVFTEREWAMFLDGAKKGEFDTSTF